MNGIFEGHPFLMLALGLLAPALLIRQPNFESFRRDWWLLPLLGLVWTGLHILLQQLPGLDLQSPAGLAAWLLLGALPFVILNRLLNGLDREFLELLLSLPVLLFWGFSAQLLPAYTHVGYWMPLIPGLAGFLLLAFLCGSQEKFRRNRAPGSLAGIPFRMLILGLLLFLVLASEALLAGRLP